MRSLFFLPFFGLITFYSCSQTSYEHEKIEVVQNNEKNVLIDASKLFSERWSELPQAKFWMEVMKLPPDSCIINVASNRQILEVTSIKKWNSQTEVQKSNYRDSLRLAYGVDSNETIFVTTGKSDFYRFKDVYPSLSKGIDAFERNNVDPWYAQAILLIESPGKLAKSISGAYGAFQLMAGVARAQGIRVDKYVDERKDFDRSAYAASNLIKRVCIPETKKILDKYQLRYKETDIWFRLLVLHVYHAGALNVAAAVEKINPTFGDQSIITRLWQTKAASFGNNSQNYTQLALASQLILDDLIHNNCDYIHSCAEDVELAGNVKPNLSNKKLLID